MTFQQARNIEQLRHLSDAQLGALVDEVETKQWPSCAGLFNEAGEIAWQKVVWLTNRAKDLAPSTY